MDAGEYGPRVRSSRCSSRTGAATATTGTTAASTSTSRSTNDRAHLEASPAPTTGRPEPRYGCSSSPCCWSPSGSPSIGRAEEASQLQVQPWASTGRKAAAAYTDVVLQDLYGLRLPAALRSEIAQRASAPPRRGDGEGGRRPTSAALSELSLADSAILRVHERDLRLRLAGRRRSTVDEYARALTVRRRGPARRRWRRRQATGSGGPSAEATHLRLRGESRSRRPWLSRASRGIWAAGSADAPPWAAGSCWPALGSSERSDDRAIEAIERQPEAARHRRSRTRCGGEPLEHPRRCSGTRRRSVTRTRVEHLHHQPSRRPRVRLTALSSGAPSC